MFGKINEEDMKRFIIMKRYRSNGYFYTERGFADRIDADNYAELLRKQEPDYEWYMFEQSKQYVNGDEKNG